MAEHLDTLSLTDAVELVCVLRRVEEGVVSAPPALEWRKWVGLDESNVCAAWKLREHTDSWCCGGRWRKRYSVWRPTVSTTTLEARGNTVHVCARDHL